MYNVTRHRKNIRLRITNGFMVIYAKKAKVNFLHEIRRIGRGVA